VLEAEQPDLVILTGDLVSGWQWNKKQKGWFEGLHQRLTQPMISHSVPWAIALGNHDAEADLTRREIVTLDRRSSLSRTLHGPLDIPGASNYYLPVFAHDRDQVLAYLWVFDSGDSNCLGVPGWGCVHPAQVEWYHKTSKLLTQKQGRIVPALAFMHIPPPEFMDVWNYENCYGRLKDEGVCCFSVNTGLFSAMKAAGDIRGVYCGHDHNNDYWGVFHNITLGYGRKTGYGAYGPPAGWLRGARVIELSHDPVFKHVSWIRQEDLSVVTSQLLHQPGTNQTFKCCPR
jgi:hypothetical protein